MQPTVNYNFKALEACEALGEDNKWYSVKIVKENVDGTFACELDKFNVQWKSVSGHNLRKLSKRGLPRDLSTEDVSKIPTASILKPRKLMLDETFSEFDEEITKKCDFSTLPNGSTVSVSDKKSVKKELSIQIDNMFDDYRRISLALSKMGASEFGGKWQEEAGEREMHSKVKFVITEEQVHEQKMTVLLPESPVGLACASPFSWFFKEWKSQKGKSRKRILKKNLKSNISDTAEDDTRSVKRGSNLIHSQAEDWNEEDLIIYRNEIQAAINRLRNASSSDPRVSDEPRVSDTSFADAYMSLSRFRLSDCSMPDNDSNQRRPENVVWLQDGTMIKSEDREQGATYFLEDPTLEPGLLPYTKRLQLSNQWDIDPTMISSAWAKGDKVEVWLGMGWQPCTIEECVIESNMSMLRVSSNQSNENHIHTVSRFGKEVRPWGYLEANDSDDESESNYI